MAASAIKLLFSILILSQTVSARKADSAKHEVTSDGCSLIINGRRQLIFSGSIHYPRSTPAMWPRLIAEAKHGGLNTIETYVFWNIHEPVEGKFAFLMDCRGFPLWLREIQNITFRTDNPTFKSYMAKFVAMIVNMMKKEKLYASEGGPIILPQLLSDRSRMSTLMWLTHTEGGKRCSVDRQHGGGSPYWGAMGDVQGENAPGAVISACNGRNCGDIFNRSNSQTKPFLWQRIGLLNRVFSDLPSQRSAEDLAFAVARFFSRNGTLINYYMYHGRTNFGRTSSFVMTRYYDEAPLDEFGLHKELKYGHLNDLHHSLRSCSKALLWGGTSFQNYGKGFEAWTYENPDMKAYCKTVAYNTQKVTCQHNSRKFHVPNEPRKNNQWQIYMEHIPQMRDTHVIARETLELLDTTKDTSDYLWYTTSVHLEQDALPRGHSIRPVLLVSNLGHAMHDFVNRRYIASKHGTNIEKSCLPSTNQSNKRKQPHSSLGFDSGNAGVHTVVIQGLNTGTLDLSRTGWGHQRYFDAPSGMDPIALDMTSMGKGMVWINGQSIGRYWVSYQNPLGDPSQSVQMAHLKCPGKKVIDEIAFASFRNPDGLCGSFIIGSCHAPRTKTAVEKAQPLSEHNSKLKEQI
ncbi:hypothetical protein ZIOFF_069816 [Zingiber officinale]|uniref:beta-galactosidase n=1 Tax=Zingiber officinale TaxID=94328 RepID=A0A8J5EUA2_ZINOF|nr:hypothetical protein ZIOFF_069816 [Zingiber officinale]